MSEHDARGQTLVELYERRKQVIRLHKQSYGVMQIVALTNLSWPAVRAAIDLYEAGGMAALKPKERGKKAGDGRSLTASGDPQLAQDGVDVELGGVGTDTEPHGNVTIGQTFGKQGQDLMLTRAKHGRGRAKRVTQVQQDLATTTAQNQRLVQTLREARDQIVALAARYGVPAMYERRDFAAAGGLMSYGNDVVDAYRKTGVYVGRILNGASPSELPVDQATKFELVVDVKAAKAIGLTIPESFLARADEVIE